MEDAQYTFSGPPFESKLTPPDQTSVFTWSPRILIFATPSSTPESKAALVSVLRSGMQATVDAWPELAGSCTMPLTPRYGEQQAGLRYHDKGLAHLKIRAWPGIQKYSLAALRASGFDQEALDPAELAPTPSWGHPTEAPLPLFAVQANFGDGGALLLVVNIYHSLVDGIGQALVTRMLADQCRAASARLSGQDIPKGLKLAFEPHQLEARRRLWDSGNVTKGDPATLSGISVLPEPLSGLPDCFKPDERPLASETFVISKDSLARLKKRAVAAKPADAAPGAYISTHDAFCALVWRTGIAARLKTGAFGPRQAVTFGMSIDGRPHLDPPLPDDLLGNFVLVNKIDAIAEELVRPEGLGWAAFALRRDVQTLDDFALRNWIAIQKEVGHTSQVFSTCLEFMKTTGLFLTSWARFDYAAIEWGERFGSCEAFRFPSGGYANGIAVVFPPLNNGDWELTLTLEEVAMRAFKEDEMWREFVKVEGADTNGVH